MKNRYYPKVSFIVFISVLILSAVTICRSEEITLTTYYPSPYGVYSEMRLHPKNNPTTPCQEGLMFYSDGSNPSYSRGLYVCGSGGWQSIAGYWSLTSNNLYTTNTTAWNVGIGTNNPGTFRLRVNGDMRVDGNVSWSGNLTSGGVPWQRLNSFPAACPSGQYVRGVGGTLTCDSAIRRINGMSGPNINIVGVGNITVSDSGNTVTISGSGGGGGGGSTGSLTVTGPGGLMSPNPWNPGSGTSATLNIASPGGGGGGYWAASGSDIYNTNAANIKIHRLMVGDTGYGAMPAPALGTDGTNVGAITNGVFGVINSGGSYADVYAGDVWLGAPKSGSPRWASQGGGGGGGGGCSWSGWKCACGADTGGGTEVVVVTALFCSSGVLTDYSNKYVHASSGTSCPVSPNPAWGCSSYSYGNY